MWHILLVSLVCCQQVQCLFEDQVGKFDWKKSYLGEIRFSSIDSRSNVKRIFVATAENVVGALALNSGSLLWRQVLENGQEGKITFFHGDYNSIITVSQDSLVRVWNPNDGSLLADWKIPVIAKNLKFLVHGGNFYVMEVALSTKQFVIHTFKIQSGVMNDVVKKVPAEWLNENTKCQTSQRTLACLVGSNVKVLSPTESQSQVQEVKVEAAGIKPISSSPGVGAFKAGNTIILSASGKPVESIPSTCESVHVDQETDKTSVICVRGLCKSSIEVETIVDNEKTSNTIQLTTQISPLHINVQSCFCKGTAPSCFCLLSTQDHTALFITSQGKSVWTREEAFANIISTEFLDLPVSDAEAAIEIEFDNTESGFIDMFIRRLVSQFYQLQTILSINSPAFQKSTSLVRDKFGLHKIILAVTSTGKIFAIDNLSGKLWWALYVPNVVPFVANGKFYAPIFVQRSTRYVPHPALVSILFKDRSSQEGVLFSINPISGQPTKFEHGQKLGYQVSLSFLLPGVGKDHVRGILLLDSKNKVHLEPPSTPVPRPYYLYKVESQAGLLTGYSVAEDLGLVKTWELNFGTPVINVASKNPLERVHSQGRILNDRTVLYKYLNPNLVAVATNSTDNVITVHLVDVVSGAIIESIVHKRVQGPFHMVHSENWLVYVYFNEKTRRNEVSTVEMYEGKVQSNSSAFSSLVKSPFKPVLDKQSYILPVTAVDTIKETITEKGITSKHILFSLGAEGILEMPWVFLDPRRPTSGATENIEEGQMVMEYAPELPILHGGIINYNQTLFRIRDIHTAPSGLESTCFVFAFGLDLFYTRVSPSKTFDMLKEDFDYALICIVLAALIIGAIVSKKLAAKKMLKQAWK